MSECDRSGGKRRYIFGEIMYGGHITDFFDRRTNNTYLSVIFNESLLRKGELAPKLVSPDCTQWDYGVYSLSEDVCMYVRMPVDKFHLLCFSQECMAA